MSKERAGLPFPRQTVELVDGGDQECWQPAIDWLIYGEHRQGAVACEIAGETIAADFKIGRRGFVRPARKRVLREPRSAPRTGLQGRGCCLVSSVSVATNATDRCVFVGFAFPTQ